MPNIFLNIPVPAGPGAGAAVDVSAMAKTKSFVIGGGFTGTVNVEYSNDDVGAGPWATIATFLQAGNLTIDFAAHWVRATSPAGAGGANLDVGSSDDGTVFALLPAAGTPVDVSALPLFKTVVTPKGFVGNVELSEDGVSWAQIFSFQAGGGMSRPYVAKFARVTGGADVWIAGAEDNGDALGPAQIRNPMALPEQWIAAGIGDGASSGPMNAQVSAGHDDVMTIRAGSIVGIRTRLSAATDGTVTAVPTINGAPVAGLTSIILAGQTDDGEQALPGAIPYGAGDVIGVNYANPASLNPTVDLEAWLEVYEELPPPAP